MADDKITQLPEVTDPIATDLGVICADPGGLPETSRVTLANKYKHIPGGFVGSLNAQLLAATLNLGDTDEALQLLDPGGANRLVVLPDEAATNHAFEILNTADAEEKLTVMDYALAKVLAVLSKGDSARFDSDGSAYRSARKWQRGALPVLHRLTLTSGVPYAPATNQTTLYCTPYLGNRMTLFNGVDWDDVCVPEISLNTNTLDAESVYDINCYVNGGAPTLEGTKWATIYSRATALAYQDGALVKSGAATRRYLGSIYLNASKQVTVGSKHVGVWNYYNRLRTYIGDSDTTDSWGYTTTAWRAWNNSAAHKIDVLIGVDENPVLLIFAQNTSTTTGFAAIGIGVGATNTNSGFFTTGGYAGAPALAVYCSNPGIGLRSLCLNEYGANGATFFGDGGVVQMSNGAVGWVEA